MNTDTTQRVPPLANIITLGTRDFRRLRDFYAAVGWPLVFEESEFAVFALRGALLALFPAERLARANGSRLPHTPAPGAPPAAHPRRARNMAARVRVRTIVVAHGAGLDGSVAAPHPVLDRPST